MDTNEIQKKLYIRCRQTNPKSLAQHIFMKKIYLLYIFCILALGSQAQTSLQLNIDHRFNKSTFAIGQLYVNDDGQVLQIDRVQYYISNVELTHDGGQTTILSTESFLLYGQKSNYDLGVSSSPINALENIAFDLGVAPTANQTQPSDYASGHALGVQTQPMYSTAQNSYIFVAIEGKIDSDQDNIPDLDFSFLPASNLLLQKVSVETEANAVNNQIQINLTADVSKWLEEIDLVAMGQATNTALEESLLMDNTNDYTVFSSTSTTSVKALVSPKNHIHVDTRLQHTPTIHYKFYTGEQIDMTITNVTGTYFIQLFELNPEGNFYLDDDLASGIYIVIFTSPKGIRQAKRFIVSK